MYRKVILGLFTLATVMASALISVPSFAQTGDSPIIYQTFGRGIHYYNAQDFENAFNELTKCVENGTQNPSVYYFRGLALMNLGREEDAAIDFKSGADLELKATTNTQKQIGYDLQFVQGPLRQTLETYRSSAKLAAYQKMQAVAAMQENINASNIDKSVGYWSTEGYVYVEGGEYEEYEDDTPAVTKETLMTSGGEQEEETESTEEDEDSFDMDEEEEEEEEEEPAEEMEEEPLSADDINLEDEVGDVTLGSDDDDDDAALGDDDDDDDAALGDDDDDDDAALGDDDDDDAALGDDDDDDDANNEEDDIEAPEEGDEDPFE